RRTGRGSRRSCDRQRSLARQPRSPSNATEDALKERTSRTDNCGITHLEFEVPITATPARVWQALVAETGRWWPKDFFCLVNPRDFVIERRAGGRVYERSQGSAELLWFTVVSVDPGKSLELVGHLTP